MNLLGIPTSSRRRVGKWIICMFMIMWKKFIFYTSMFSHGVGNKTLNWIEWIWNNWKHLIQHIGWIIVWRRLNFFKNVFGLISWKRSRQWLWNDCVFFCNCFVFENERVDYKGSVVRIVIYNGFLYHLFFRFLVLKKCRNP